MLSTSAPISGTSDSDSLRVLPSGCSTVEAVANDGQPGRGRRQRLLLQPVGRNEDQRAGGLQRSGQQLDEFPFHKARGRGAHACMLAMSCGNPHAVTAGGVSAAARCGAITRAAATMNPGNQGGSRDAPVLMPRNRRS